jgi:1-acyl-sn-glycerol-3-phosphate acyltransferase
MTGWLRIAWVVLAILAVTLVLLPIHLVALGLRLPARIRIPRLWHRAAAAIIGIRIHHHGRLETARPLMLVSNHVSWKDILVLGASADVTFVAKAGVRNWPVFGLLARLQRTIFVEREQRSKSGEQAGEMALRMGAGEIVVLFPEGTTSDGNRLLEVKSSLFGAATSAVAASPTGLVHVQPVALAYTRIHGLPLGHYHRPMAAWPGDVAMLPHLVSILRDGALDVDVCFGEAITVSTTTNRKLLCAEAETQIRRMLAERLRGR